MIRAGSYGWHHLPRIASRALIAFLSDREQAPTSAAPEDGPVR
jgi:hypothetical protein